MCSHQSPIEDIYDANIEHVDKNDECYTRFVRSLFSFKNISINLSSTFFKNLKIWFQLLIPIKKNTRIARFEITRTPINFTTNSRYTVRCFHKSCPAYYERNVYVQLICLLCYYVFTLRISSFQHERLFMQSSGSSTIAHRSCNLECLILEHDCDAINRHVRNLLYIS